MEALKQWHGWYVTERWEPADEAPLRQAFVQAEKLPGFRCGRWEAPALALSRIRLERVWSELNHVVDDELVLGHCCSAHYRLLKEVREFLDEGALRARYYRYHARVLGRYLREHEAYEFERVVRVLRATIRLLDVYADGLNCLERAEREAMWK